MFVYIADVLPVLETIVDHAPPLVDRSILYPTIGEPPSFPGALQLRLICDDDIVVAERFVGDWGGNICALVVADTMFDGELVPTEFIAETL